MKRRNIFGLISGIILLSGSVFFSLRGIFNEFTGIVTLNSGFVMVLSSLIRHFKDKNEVVERDERTKIIAYTSLAAAFQLSLAGMMLLWWINYIFPINLTLNGFISLAFIGMSVIAIITRFYYERKGVNL